LFQEIHFTDGDTAGGDQEIAGLKGLFEGSAGGLQSIVHQGKDFGISA
jgi:hypothetical protein